MLVVILADAAPSATSRIRTRELNATTTPFGGAKPGWRPPDDIRRMRVTIDNDALVAAASAPGSEDKQPTEKSSKHDKVCFEFVMIYTIVFSLFIETQITSPFIHETHFGNDAQFKNK
jgi:hypothetical protein